MLLHAFPDILRPCYISQRLNTELHQLLPSFDAMTTMANAMIHLVNVLLLCFQTFDRDSL